MPADPTPGSGSRAETPGEDFGPVATSPSPGPAYPRRRTPLIVAIAVIAVAVVVVVSLFATGVLPVKPQENGAYPGEALSYEQARPLADAAADSATGAPWSLISVSAMDTLGGDPFPDGLFCMPITNSPSYLTAARPGVPAFDGSLSSGTAPWWLFEYENGSFYHFITNGEKNVINETILLDVVVVNGTALALATWSSQCDLILSPVVPYTGIVDSPVAMATALDANASFIAAHPRLNSSLGLDWLENTSTPGGPPTLNWVATFTTCAPGTQYFGDNSTSYLGYSLEVFVSAAEGSLAPGFEYVPATLECSSTG
jgi:hypothetical protein